MPFEADFSNFAPPGDNPETLHVQDVAMSPTKKPVLPEENETKKFVAPPETQSTSTGIGRLMARARKQLGIDQV